MIDTQKHNTVYLYSFKDAQIADEYRTIWDDTPTQSGYVYSTKKLNSGESIQVWTHMHWGSVQTSNELGVGVSAVVDELIETYSIDVDAKTDTYRIAYFEFSMVKTTFSDRELVQELKKSEVEVVKERVSIEYYVD